MRRTAKFFLWVAALLSFAGCNRAASPQTAANDIAEAKQSAAREVADARREAAERIEHADRAVQEKSNDLADTNLKAGHDVAVAKADGIRKIALRQCMTQDDGAQKRCKEQANAEYDAGVAQAKALRAAQAQ